MLRRALAISLISLTLPAGSTPAHAEPGFTDPIGDANHVNHQGAREVPLPDAGPDTRPASIPPADVVEARFETVFETIVERADDGRPRRVRHLPTGLRLRLRTAAPIAPTHGPTVTFSFFTLAEGCPLAFRIHARGALSDQVDPPQRAEVAARPGCPGGAATYADGIALDLRGALTVVEVPFTAVRPGGAGLLEAGSLLAPDARGGEVAARVGGGVDAVDPLIDTVAPMTAFRVGSDVPPDLDCIEDPGALGCAGDGPNPDTGEDLHDALLASGPPARVADAGSVDLSTEFVVYSFRPDGRWVSFPFDLARAGFDASYIEINLAARLVRDGEVMEEFLPIGEAFADWKLLHGPADDPHRSVSSLVQDTPYGITIALQADGLDRLTLLGAADVRADADVALVVGMRATDSPEFGEPFPDAFGEWMRGWTQGMTKVRLVPDRWGSGVRLAARLAELGALTPYDERRDVTVTDDRTRVGTISTAGEASTSAALVADGPAFSTTSLFYVAAASQEVSIEWRTPDATRRGSRSSTGSSGATLSAVSTDAGPGTYGLRLDVTSDPERSSSLSFIHDLWPLDAEGLFPGIDGSFFSDPEASPAVLAPGAWTAGVAPPVVVSLAAR